MNYIILHPTYITAFGEKMTGAKAKKQFGEETIKTLLESNYIQEDANDTAKDGDQDNQDNTESE